MKLNADEMQELNKLLSSKALDLPSFRRSVSKSGGNFRWLQRNINSRNKDLDPRLSQLLGLRTSPIIGDLDEQQKTQEQGEA